MFFFFVINYSKTNRILPYSLLRRPLGLLLLYIIICRLIKYRFQKLIIIHHLQPDLSGTPFFELQKRWQKRVGAEGGNAAQKLMHFFSF